MGRRLYGIGSLRTTILIVKTVKRDIYNTFGNSHSWFIVSDRGCTSFNFIHASCQSGNKVSGKTFVDPARSTPNFEGCKLCHKGINSGHGVEALPGNFSGVVGAAKPTRSNIGCVHRIEIARISFQSVERVDPPINLYIVLCIVNTSRAIEGEEEKRCGESLSWRGHAESSDGCRSDSGSSDGPQEACHYS